VITFKLEKPWWFTAHIQTTVSWPISYSAYDMRESEIPFQNMHEVKNLTSEIRREQQIEWRRN
jgi:hypothetical protein